jgi:hypothetical protein
MKARGARARSLRLLLQVGNYPSYVVPPLSAQADAKSVLWHLNHFFEDIDCSQLRTVLLGRLELLGPLSEIMPLVRGAGSLRTLKLHANNTKVMGDCTKHEFTNLRSLHITSGGRAGGIGADFNCLLAVCPELRKLHLYEGGGADAPLVLVSKSVEELSCEGKGLHGLRALDMPALRHFTDDMGCYGPLNIGQMKGRCSYDMFSPLINLESVKTGGYLFMFPASRGVRSTGPPLLGGRTSSHKPSNSLCTCTVCATVDSEGAGAAF